MNDWDDVGYRRPDPYEGTLDDACPRCKAPADTRCINPITQQPAHVPCIGRMKS